MLHFTKDQLFIGIFSCKSKLEEQAKGSAMSVRILPGKKSDKYGGDLMQRLHSAFIVIECYKKYHADRTLHFQT